MATQRGMVRFPSLMRVIASSTGATRYAIIAPAAKGSTTPRKTIIATRTEAQRAASVRRRFRRGVTSERLYGTSARPTPHAEWTERVGVAYGGIDAQMTLGGPLGVLRTLTGGMRSTSKD